jgi:hypothetical protein
VINSYIVISNNFILGELAHDSAVLDLPLDLVPVDLNMRHVDDHNIAEDVGVTEVVLESVQLCTRFLELSSRPRLSVIHHQPDLFQLLI